jgi:hypothetical protein
MDGNKNYSRNSEAPAPPGNPLLWVVIVGVMLVLLAYFYLNAVAPPAIEHKIVDTTDPGPPAKYILDNDPEAYLQEMIAKKDIHFLVIKGTREHPGVSNEMAAKYGMRLISGTCADPTDVAYENQAEAYAKKFNLLLVDYLQKNPQQQ